MADKLTALNNFKENPAYQLGDKVAEICAPLFNNFPICYVGYSRVYHDNSMVRLHSNKDHGYHFLQSKCSYYYPLRNIKLIYIPSLYTQQLSKIYSSDNLYNGFGMAKIYNDFVETIEFWSSNPYTTPLEFCTNKELLNKFILYFKDKASSIIKTLERDPLYLPKNRIVNLENPNQSWTDFCQAIKTQKLLFKFKAQEVFFTRREFDILSLLAKGKTMREIATILKISPRTVEAYLYNAKNKTNTFTVSQLLDYFVDSLF